MIQELLIPLQTFDWQSLSYPATVFLISLALLYLFKFIILSRLHTLAQKTKTKFDNIIVETLQTIKSPFYIAYALYATSFVVAFHPLFDRVIFYMVVYISVFYVMKAVFRSIDYGIEVYSQKEDNDNHLIDVLGRISKIFIVIMGILLILANWGVNIASLIAGLGIGGLAIAFALQRILEDLFASFSIYFDKPFKKGDFIVIGADNGVVQKIGLKSTRIKTLQGQELIVSNRELTSERVNNYKKMDRRRIVFDIGVEYGTPVKKLEKIPKIIAHIMEGIEEATLDRAHFKAFGDFSLDYEIVYYMKVPDYAAYMDVQQRVNLDLVRAFEKEKIEFAFPTQTIHVKK